MYIEYTLKYFKARCNNGKLGNQAKQHQAKQHQAKQHQSVSQSVSQSVIIAKHGTIHIESILNMQ